MPSQDPGTLYDQEWLAPHKVGTGASQIAVSAGPCYLWNNNDALCLGDGVGDGYFGGELGEEGTVDPYFIEGLTGLIGITRSADYVCGLSASKLQCANHSFPNSFDTGLVVPAAPRIRSGGWDVCLGSTSTEGDIQCLNFGVPQFGIDTPFNAIKPAVGFDHACAISGGTVYCWGGCDNGQCGLEQPTTPNVPAAVLSDVEDVYAGNKISCAKKTDGSVVCWGAITSTDVGYQPRPIQWN